MESYDRWINVSGAVNVRDLGGYAAEAGSTRWRSFFRADNLHRLTEDDQRMLLEAGVHTVIDLRHGNEVEAAPNVFAAHPDVRYLNIPVFRQAPPSSQSVGTMPDLPTVYRYMVDHCQAGFGEALAAVADAPEGAVLYHCTAGKDRTGILTALLLRLVGVSTADIVADYALTTEAMLRLRPLLMEQVLKNGGSVEDTERMLSSEPADMETLLNYLDEQYGGVFNYLETLGLTEAQIDRIRTRLLAS